MNAKTIVVACMSLGIGGVLGAMTTWQLTQHSDAQLARQAFQDLRDSFSYIADKTGTPRTASDVEAYAKNMLAWQTVHLGQSFSNLNEADRTAALELVHRIEGNDAFKLDVGESLGRWSAGSRKCVLTHAPRDPGKVSECTLTLVAPKIGGVRS